MAQNFVAIDWNGARAKVVVVEATLRRAEITSIDTFVFSASADKKEMLTLLRSKLPAQIDSLVVNVDGVAVSTRHLQFPISDLRKVEPAIHFELENQLPYSRADAAATWHICEKSAHRTRVLAAVTPRTLLVERLQQLSDSGLEPRGMIMPGAALAELLPKDLANEHVGVLSLGERESHLLIANSHGPHFVRTLRVGSAEIDAALAKRFVINEQQAKSKKEQEGKICPPGESGSSDEMAQGIVEGLGNLLRTLGTTLRALPADDMPKKLFLTGGGSRLSGIADYLAARLGIPVELLDVRGALGTMPCRVPSVGPEYAVAVGLALGLIRRGAAIPLNFRTGEFAYHGDIQVYRGEVTRIAVGLAAVFALAIVGSIIRYSMISAEERNLNKAFCTATQKIVGREICDPTAALATLKQAPGAVEGVVIPPYSAAFLFDVVSKMVGSEIDVSFQELDFKVDGRAAEPDKMSGKGEAASFETIESFLARLKSEPCVTDAEVSKQRKNSDNSRVEFSFSAKLSCSAGVVPGTQNKLANVVPSESPSNSPEEAPKGALDRDAPPSGEENP